MKNNSIGSFIYVGPCDCQRVGLVKGKLKVLCDGRLYKVVSPNGKSISFWCRDRHHMNEGLKESF